MQGNSVGNSDHNNIKHMILIGIILCEREWFLFDYHNVLLHNVQLTFLTQDLLVSMSDLLNKATDDLVSVAKIEMRLPVLAAAAYFEYHQQRYTIQDILRLTGGKEFATRQTILLLMQRGFLEKDVFSPKGAPAPLMLLKLPDDMQLDDYLSPDNFRGRQHFKTKTGDPLPTATPEQFEGVKNLLPMAWSKKRYQNNFTVVKQPVEPPARRQQTVPVFQHDEPELAVDTAVRYSKSKYPPHIQHIPVPLNDAGKMQLSALWLDNVPTNTQHVQIKKNTNPFVLQRAGKKQPMSFQIATMRFKENGGALMVFREAEGAVTNAVLIENPQEPPADDSLYGQLKRQLTEAAPRRSKQPSVYRLLRQAMGGP